MIAYGQKQDKTIILTGTVYDQVGSTTSGAKVIATDALNKQFETISKQDGTYQLSLPVSTFEPGRDFLTNHISVYSVKVLMSGFHVTEIKGLKFVRPQSGTLHLDAVLELGINNDD